MTRTLVTLAVLLGAHGWAQADDDSRDLNACVRYCVEQGGHPAPVCQQTCEEEQEEG